MFKTKVLKVDSDSPDENKIEFAATILKNGGLVAFPTETVYGIGANALNKKTIERLYEVKKRPRNKPFTMHISNIDMIKKMNCEISPLAELLIKEFWPGPLTLILTCTTAAVGQLSNRGGWGGRLGFRMPKNNVAKDLISKSSVPVAAPSANVSGERPPAQADEVLRKFDGKIDLILDGGRTEFGRESTIVDVTVPPYKILREAAIPKSEIARIWEEL